MPATLIDGLALAKATRARIAHSVSELPAHRTKPGLAVILVGADPASQVYVRNKIKACADVGFHSVLIEMSAETQQDALLGEISRLNADINIHGILVQLPLPKHIDAHAVIEAISPAKDVDGFHLSSAGALMTGRPSFVPCTPAGVMRMLETAHIPLRGAEAVVIGASNIVGKPMAHLLLQAGATVTICNSKTRDLPAHTRRADILVVAVGRPKMVTAEMIKPGATVIDVGINRLPDGKLCGDVDFESAQQVAGHLTPVPGGVGPMTIAMLLENTLIAAQRT